MRFVRTRRHFGLRTTFRIAAQLALENARASFADQTHERHDFVTCRFELCAAFVAGHLSRTGYAGGRYVCHDGPCGSIANGNSARIFHRHIMWIQDGEEFFQGSLLGRFYSANPFLGALVIKPPFGDELVSVRIVVNRNARGKPQAGPMHENQVRHLDDFSCCPWGLCGDSIRR